MKIKRFVAADMRQAMREVREEQGPDAVILSTRRLDDGIEIIAAVDYDEALVREAARHGMPMPEASTAMPVAPPAARPERTPLLTRAKQAMAAATHAAAPASTAAPVQASAPEPRPPVAAPVVTRQPDATPPAAQMTAPVAAPSAPPVIEPMVLAMPPIRETLPPQASALQPPQPARVEPAPIQSMLERAAKDNARMRAELGDLRSMLETQLSSLAWNDMERRHPLRARILRDLTRLGIEADVARQLIDELPDQISTEQARYLPLGVLSRSLAVSGRDLAATGGVIALVGPTGVGKTTTIAKLAARAVLRHGAQQVALISTDNYRIGAAAQLEHYGRLLGVRVFPAHDAVSLRQVLTSLRGRAAVLVDTAGVAGNDPRLQQQIELLQDVGEVRVCVAMAANTQAQALDATIRAYLPLKPQACILTKLDETPNLGGALSTLIRHHLPLDYVTDGQRVPEDIAAADARALVCRAAQALKTGGDAEDATMAERFGLSIASA
ncbi:flagellar biosynthesis protein FlhF [Dyella sp.]|uniref:flagellar biosynthesis protein FlhF n=1 Tax=Dyella sp. TaxID=1869338 RepID=UPI002ED1306F